MNTDALLSSESVEHYSPPSIVEPSRVALGGVIDLDPFSCILANSVVKARSFFNIQEDGFAQDWYGNVFCNPPGGKLKGKSCQALAWRKLMTERAHRVSAAVFVCFNLGFLQVSQGLPCLSPLHFPICYPRSRVAYLVDRLPQPTEKYPNRKPTKKQIEDFQRTGLCEGDSPPGASCIVFVPSCQAEVLRFVEAFMHLGEVVVPCTRQALTPSGDAV